MLTEFILPEIPDSSTKASRSDVCATLQAQCASLETTSAQYKGAFAAVAETISAPNAQLYHLNDLEYPKACCDASTQGHVHVGGSLDDDDLIAHESIISPLSYLQGESELAVGATGALETPLLFGGSLSPLAASSAVESLRHGGTQSMQSLIVGGAPSFEQEGQDEPHSQIPTAPFNTGSFAVDSTTIRPPYVGGTFNCVAESQGSLDCLNALTVRGDYYHTMDDEFPIENLVDDPFTCHEASAPTNEEYSEPQLQGLGLERSHGSTELTDLPQEPQHSGAWLDQHEACDSEGDETCDDESVYEELCRATADSHKKELGASYDEAEASIAKLKLMSALYNRKDYLVLNTGDIYGLRFNCNEDLRRWQVKSNSQLSAIGPLAARSIPHLDNWRAESYCQTDETRVSVADLSHHWLTTLAIACVDADLLEELLVSGVIQSTLRSCKSDCTYVQRMWLLIILRLAASSLTHGHSLIYAVKDLYSFILETLQSVDEHFMNPVKRRDLSYVRGYELFILLALAAHTRPLITSRASLGFDKEVQYRHHAHLMLSAYAEATKDTSRDFTAHLPRHLSKAFQNLTTHTMAMEIFIDVVKFGLYSYFATRIMNIKWERTLTRFLSRGEVDALKVVLTQVIHQAPKEVAARVTTPSYVYKMCYAFLAAGLDHLMKTNFFCTQPDQGCSCSSTFILYCCRALSSMVRGRELGSNYEGASDYLRNETRMMKLVSFVSTAASCREFIRVEANKELYESVWALIYNSSYTFPFMVETMLDWACDQSTPLILRGHAATFTGSLVVYAGYPVTRAQLLRIYHSINCYAAAAMSQSSRDLRLELAFRIRIFFNKDKFDIEELTEKWPKFAEDPCGSRNMFLSYTFKHESAPHEHQPKYVDALLLLEQGEEVDLSQELTSNIEIDFAEVEYAIRWFGAEAPRNGAAHLKAKYADKIS